MQPGKLHCLFAVYPLTLARAIPGVHSRLPPAAIRSALYDEHAAVGVVADADGGVAKQTAPKLRGIAVADDDQIVTAFSGELHDGLRRMPARRFATDVQFVSLGGFLH